jgi:hypothetical protein
MAAVENALSDPVDELPRHARAPAQLAIESYQEFRIPDDLMPPQLYPEGTSMDLVTLIAACALSVDPKVMHALVFEQSVGEPWSFSVPGESLPRVLPTMQDALRAARATRPEGGRIQVGLTGLSTTPGSVTALALAPCPNITLATRQLTELVERCKTSSKPDPIYCAIAAYHGSWDRPDTYFANAVRATVEKGNAPDFDMPKDAFFEESGIAPAPPTSSSHAALTTPASTLDDHARGWSSGLFPAKPAKPDGTSADTQNGDPAADGAHQRNPAAAMPGTTKAPVDSLFVPRSSERRP